MNRHPARARGRGPRAGQPHVKPRRRPAPYPRALAALPALAVLLAACLPRTAADPAPTPQLITATPPASASIRGAVWADFCDEMQPATPACRQDGAGQYRAN